MSSGERKRKRLNREEQSFRGLGLHLVFTSVRRNGWEAVPKSMIVAYLKTEVSEQDPEYRGTRETPWEDRGTTL